MHFSYGWATQVKGHLELAAAGAKRTLVQLPLCPIHHSGIVTAVRLLDSAGQDEVMNPYFKKVR